MKWPEAMLGGYPLILMIGCLYHNILSYVNFFFYMLWIQGFSQGSIGAKYCEICIVYKLHENWTRV